MKSVTVFCGASRGNDNVYEKAGIQLGNLLAAKNITVIFGGGKIGMMGIVADAALQIGVEVVGVIPKFLQTKEVAHTGLHHMHVTKTMHERKALMHQLSDGVIALAGGFGTLDELFEILTWAQLGLHDYPIGLLNTNGYFDHLILFLDKMVKDGFLSEVNRSMLLVHEDPTKLLELMENYVAPDVPKWITDDQL